MFYCVHEEGKINRKSKGFKIQFENEIVLTRTQRKYIQKNLSFIMKKHVNALSLL